MRKLMRSAPSVLFASMIACRKEPAPLSLVFRTVNVAAKAGMVNTRSCWTDHHKKSRPIVALNNFVVTIMRELSRNRKFGPRKNKRTKGRTTELIAAGGRY